MGSALIQQYSKTKYTASVRDGYQQ